ncbi:MAG: hypothetical protein QJR01_02235 [Kyrpidia sp.]|nr:hypothetical protein [Kyrpidia sp.]
MEPVKDGFSWGMGLGVVGAAVAALKGDWYPAILPIAVIVAINGAVRRASGRPEWNGALAGAVAGILTMGVYAAVHGGTLLTGAGSISPALPQFLLEQLFLMAAVVAVGTWLTVRARRFAEEQRRRRRETRRAERNARRRHKKKKK